MTTEKIYALAILAHPDDEAFLLAGTSLKFAEEGKSVAVICATHGEKGADRLNRNLTEKEMAQIRAEELQTACKIIGCNCQEFFNYPDGALDQADFKLLVQDLVAKIEQYQPKIILTFGQEGISGHKDHIAIGEAAVAATKQSNHQASEIWRASIPASAMKAFKEYLAGKKVHHKHFQKNTLQGVPDEKLLKINISKYAEQKNEAIKAHESQYLPHLTFDLFLQYECFEIVRLS